MKWLLEPVGNEETDHLAILEPPVGDNIRYSKAEGRRPPVSLGHSRAHAVRGLHLGPGPPEGLSRGNALPPVHTHTRARARLCNP